MPTVHEPAASTELVPVPPLNLGAQFEAVREPLLAELGAVASSGMYVLGAKVAAFEEALARYCGAPHAVGYSSGTDALLAAMMAIGVGPGDEVLVPTFTFFATAGTVARLGARPVFCDVDAASFNLDPAEVERRATPRTKAVVPVHLYGQCAEMGAIEAIARRGGFAVIEDAAQAIGATTRDGRRAGAMGLMSALSFYPTKNLGALGDAGAVVTADATLAEMIRKIRVHGSGHTYYHDVVGGNFRIDAIQAAVLSVKLPHLDHWTEQRRERAARYCALLDEAGLTPDPIQPPRELNGRHVYHQFVIRTPRRDELVAFLKDRKIGAGVYYPLPLHLQACFASLGGKAGDFPAAERAAAEVLALPMYPELTDLQQRAVVDAISRFFRQG